MQHTAAAVRMQFPAVNINIGHVTTHTPHIRYSCRQSVCKRVRMMQWRPNMKMNSSLHQYWKTLEHFMDLKHKRLSHCHPAYVHIHNCIVYITNNVLNSVSLWLCTHNSLDICMTTGAPGKDEQQLFTVTCKLNFANITCFSSCQGLNHMQFMSTFHV